MVVVMALALSIIGGRLIYLQAVGNSAYERLARSQLRNIATVGATRGSIFDRNGANLALSVARQTIYADPSHMKDPGAIARVLAPILGRPEPELVATLSQRNLQFTYLARRVEPKLADQVAKLELPGVGQMTESKREYPDARLAGPVLGWVGTDKGLGGLEHQYNKFLSGTPGSLQAERDPSGREIPGTGRREVPAQRGGDLVLTLDQSLQYEVNQRLAAEVQKAKALGGTAVVMDIRTGDVLAMASVDGPTDTRPARPAPPTESNHPLTDVHEPGSTAKVITVAAALESGTIDMNTRFQVPWETSVGGAKFQDDEQHSTGNWTVREILTHSSNVGTIQIADKVGRTALDQMMRNFGFNARTPIGFPSESPGILPSPFQVDPAIMGSMPIGYGIATTAMQTLSVFTTVANGGVTRPPRLVAATIDSNGRRHRNAPLAARRVISAATAAQLNELLQEVVRTGTGVRASIPGYTVAGKTGTARKKPYVMPYKYFASFVGFAPAESPRLAAVVVLDEPQGQVYGGAVAAPVFKSIMQYALRLEGVAPSPPASASAPVGSGQ